MSLVGSIATNPTALAAGAVLGALLGPAAAAATVAVPSGLWPWQAGSRRWLLGAPAATALRWLLILAGIVVLGSLAAVIGWRPALVAFLSVGLFGITLAVIDLRHHRLPNRLTGTGAVVSGIALLVDAVLTGSWPALLSSGMCAAVGFAVLFAMALAGPRGMGFGDVKLAALLSAHTGWLGWEVAVTALLGAFLLGALAALLLVVTGRVGLRTAIPFGPALLAGAWLTVLASAWPVPA